MSGHREAHPRSGERVMLDLSDPDPLGVLFDRAVVVVVDWQERVTGRPWGRKAGAHPLHHDYHRRRLEVDDPDVVAVLVDERTGHRLVHESELGKAVISQT